MASPTAGPAPEAAPAGAVPRVHPARRVAASLGLVACLCVVAEAGPWYVPFVLGVMAGVWPRPRAAVLAVTACAVAGWALALWKMALDGLPVGATARAIAALAGLPPYAGVTVTVTLLLAVLQVLVGAWLARAVIPRKAFAARPSAGQGKPSGEADPQVGPAADPQA
jgi:hypothetical protein